VKNDYLNTAKELLSDFSPISLAEMDKVKLMDRMDSKFVFSFTKLAPVLKSLWDQYKVLTINSAKVFSYRTEYYDTPNLAMFSDHHNGKLNRYKIRQREYIESQIRFLEIKFKTNKGRVIKDRIERIPDVPVNFDSFITRHTPYNPENLDVTLVNNFNRFTLVDNNLQERVTVDFNLSFSDMVRELDLKELVVIEVKQNKNNRNGAIFNSLRANSLRPESFSKYCLGISLLHRHNKFNNFKRTINLVNKLSHVEISA